MRTYIRIFENYYKGVVEIFKIKIQAFWCIFEVAHSLGWPTRLWSTLTMFPDRQLCGLAVWPRSGTASCSMRMSRAQCGIVRLNFTWYQQVRWQFPLSWIPRFTTLCSHCAWVTVSIWACLEGHAGVASQPMAMLITKRVSGEYRVRAPNARIHQMHARTSNTSKRVKFTTT